jgi:hypothetical protein
MKEFMDKASAEIKNLEDKLAAIQKTFKESCEFYLIDKGDEKASNSMEFFKFFTGFIDSVIKSMPKEEKKKKEPPGAGAGAGGAKKFSEQPKNNLIAELKMKQAAQK